MKKTYTSERIFYDVKHSNLNKAEATKQLISIIEGSDDIEVRTKCIEIIEKIQSKTENVYRLLENCMISDENPLVRSTAAKVLIRNFSNEDLSSLIWTIQNDNSPIVIQTILDQFEKDDHKQHKVINDKLKNWVNDFAFNLGIIPGEAKFILDIENLFAKSRKNY